MKVLITVARAEGFIARYALAVYKDDVEGVVDAEPLVLQTRDNLLWDTKDARAKTRAKFRALVEALRAAGIAVEGQCPDE